MEKRRFERHELEGIGANVDRWPMGVVNISDQGVLLEDRVGRLTQGDAVCAVLTMPLMNKSVPVEIYGEVVRREGDHAALRYDEPVRTWHRLLEVLKRKQQAARG